MSEKRASRLTGISGCVLMVLLVVGLILLLVWALGSSGTSSQWH
ncbi:MULTISPECIES: hypothetical protein [unclassified Kitasatospora]|nr:MULTISPECIES: hypothetical protein [unclassified Kitasatospora]